MVPRFGGGSLFATCLMTGVRIRLGPCSDAPERQLKLPRFPDTRVVSRTQRGPGQRRRSLTRIQGRPPHHHASLHARTMNAPPNRSSTLRPRPKMVELLSGVYAHFTREGGRARFSPAVRPVTPCAPGAFQPSRRYCGRPGCSRRLPLRCDHEDAISGTTTPPVRRSSIVDRRSSIRGSRESEGRDSRGRPCRNRTGTASWSAARSDPGSRPPRFSEPVTTYARRAGRSAPVSPHMLGA